MTAEAQMEGFPSLGPWFKYGPTSHGLRPFYALEFAINDAHILSRRIWSLSVLCFVFAFLSL